MKNLLMTAFMLVLCAGMANATIISVNGSGGILASAPADLTEGGSEDFNVQGFDETQNVSIDADSVSVTYLNPNGDYSGDDNLSVFLDAGIYSSHILHYDPVGDGGNTGQISAEFTFDGSIVGLITSTSLLDASDALFGLATLTYDTANQGRRAEDSDTFSVAGNVLTAKFFQTTGAYVDEVRVLTVGTSPVPEPSTFLLLGGGLLGLGWYGRKRKKA